MNIVLLSGGSGKRLWPLSNEIRSKQFLKLLSDANGGHESMVQRVYRQITQAGIQANIVVATSATQVDSIRGQLPDDVAGADPFQDRTQRTRGKTVPGRSHRGQQGLLAGAEINRPITRKAVSF